MLRPASDEARAGMTARALAASVNDGVQALDTMPAVERARAIPPLIEACRALQSELSAERKAAMEEATTGAWKLSRAGLARELGLSKSKVTELLGPRQEGM